MKVIASVPKTTLSVHKPTREQLAGGQEIFCKLSRKELALTVCEPKDWTTPNAVLKVPFASALLDGTVRCAPRHSGRARRSGAMS